jgi:hypothetical protein
MSMVELIGEALKLQRAERAAFALRLILDGPPDAEVEAAWGAEVSERMRALDAGEALEDWETVLLRIRAGLRAP